MAHSPKVEHAASEIALALDTWDVEKFQHAVRSFLRGNKIKTSDILHSSVGKVVSQNLDRAFDLTIRLEKHERQLMLLHLQAQQEVGNELTHRAQLSKQHYEQATRSGKLWQSTHRYDNPGEFGIPDLQVLVVRWRFWLALFLVDSNLEAFASALEPGFGSKAEVQGGLFGYHLYIVVDFTPDGEGYSVILDSGCTHSTVSLDFLGRKRPDARIRQFQRPSLMGGVYGNSVVKDYAIVDVYVRAEHPVSGKTVMAKITREFQVQSRASERMLIGQDIIKHHGFVIDNEQDIVVIGSCEGVRAQILSQPCSLLQMVDEDFDMEREMEGLEKIARDSHKPFLGA
ncbi:hypothetical protein LTR85_008333 [Meristemomyces frigidus]|nr:hypothetical protein LTR85_008333 [Meristemomyces frigidus]